MSDIKKIDHTSHSPANRRIDSTIGNIIRWKRFKVALSDHLKLTKLVKSINVSESKFTCSIEGVFLKGNKNCY